jgi:putative ABC transport system substrate-binding protein
VRRRQFIAGLGSAAVWPVVARAQQQPERMRQIGVLMNLSESDPEGRLRVVSFQQGLILPQDPFTGAHRQLIIELAARHRLPAVYAFPHFAAAGGLLSYGVNVVDQYGQAATYFDRILRGTKPADLPVQQPTKLELVINLKTAKALGLTIPETLLATADEVIE